MTREQKDELEDAAWGVTVVDAAVKLYLLAYVRTGNHESATQMAGLRDADARSARGWLRHVGVLSAGDEINGKRLREAPEGQLTPMAA